MWLILKPDLLHYFKPIDYDIQNHKALDYCH